MNWISVEDKLPEVGQKVLVYERSDPAGIKYFVTTWGRMSINFYSHWMPLKPPETK